MSTYKFSQYLTALLITSAATLIQAQDIQAPSNSSWRFVGSLGYSVGGDRLVSGNYANTGNSYSIRAGKGLEVMVGAEYQIVPLWSARATLGWHEDSTNATNGEFKFQRYPLELVGLYELAPSWRVGAGLHRANSAKFSSSGVVSSAGSASFDGSTGLALVGQYLFTPSSGNNKLRTGIEAKYVKENFTRKNSQTKFNGDHLSLALVVMY